MNQCGMGTIRTITGPTYRPAEVKGNRGKRGDEQRVYLNNTRSPTDHGIVLLINNLGGTSTLEMAVVTGETTLQLDPSHHLKHVRIYTSTFI
ncbi:hypothetical protein M434DRAFT_101898 [Hypoxylon sp. CO27-5]|nr:hypothetical protein M434DRAFT_101898 [Hypoxylon sp. CO27-5]